MATEINESGYETLRASVNSGVAAPDPWDYIELIDDTGATETRVSVSGDPRASWTTTETDQTQQVEITVTGADADISTPVTISGSALKASDSDSAPEKHRDTMSDAVLAEDQDELIVRHNVEIPQVQ